MHPIASRGRPSWRSRKLGTRVRVALWLLDEVGEGKTFTTDQLQEAFPEDGHVSRRLRDLRRSGWVIQTSRTSSELGGSEMLFAKAGEPVWEPDPAVHTRRIPTRRIRDEVLARDGYSCTNCGLSVVEGFIEAPVTAVLELAYLKPLTAGGSNSPENLITLCANCHMVFDRERDKLLDTEDVWNLVSVLSPQNRARLLAWIAIDQKPPTPAEKAWALYRRLRPDQRTAIARRLGQAVIDQTESDTPT
ncbi:HNH endonuclease [Streptosporangium sp. NPDC000509]|uniref:HNH endonuclease n=1 Tax=Streptosporangium sp. NPDC000509 TaxID=3366186 RepID=UPI0036C259B4